MRKQIEVYGVNVRFYEAGIGSPILLLHGAGGQARLWRRLMGPLSKRHRVIAPDLPGFGGSDYSPSINSVRDYAKFVADFIDALGIERASIVGSSMGGWAACWLALDFPERVVDLVLISPAGLYFPDNPPMSVPQVIAELKDYYAKAALDAEALNTGSGAELEKAVHTITAIDEKGGSAPDLAGRLSGIKARTLIIWGTADRVIPASYAGAFGSGIEGSKVVMLDDAGHLPYIERPEECYEIIKGFLEATGFPLAQE